MGREEEDEELALLGGHGGQELPEPHTQGLGGLGVLTLGFELQENLQPSVPEEAEQSQPGREERGEKQGREGWEPSPCSTSSAARRLQCAAASPAASAAGDGSERGKSDKREG